MANILRNLKKTPLADQLNTQSGSAFVKYKKKVVGDITFFRFCLYECYSMLCANLGGALGYLMRKMAAKYLFRSVGPGLIVGRGLAIRHPVRISLGANVAIDDNVFLDASGSDEIGVQLLDGVVLSRNCCLLGKVGHIVIMERVNIGFNCVFASASGITIGPSTIIAGNCFFGGGRYYYDSLEQPIIDQGAYSRGELVVGENSWIGAEAVILDGVKLGKGVIVGAGAVVTKDAPDYAVLVGNPARILRIRGENESSNSAITNAD